jgi:hypothetical protein
MMMKTKLFMLLLVGCAGFILSCEKQNTAEALQLQKPYTYSDQYYSNLRAYKKTKHQVFYGWFAAYANKEGVTAEYKRSASWGEHFAGLPDSLDYCSLWMGIPSLKQDDPLSTYNPIAYNEMRHVMEVKGTKMLVPEITRIAKYPQFEKSDVGIQKYADYLVKMVLDHDLDGLDLDYEPEGDWIQGANFLKMVEIIGKSLGPKSSNPEKYLIIDYYTQLPLAGVEPYINFLVNQSYTQGTTSSSATFLQGRYNSVASWCPASKFIVTENFGDWYANGGSPFTEADGNTLSSDGKRMYSLEGMARWNPTQGKKAGFGAFYFDRDYNSGDPYSTVRRAIQIANPAVR